MCTVSKGIQHTLFARICRCSSHRVGTTSHRRLTMHNLFIGRRNQSTNGALRPHRIALRLMSNASFSLFYSPLYFRLQARTVLREGRLARVTLTCISIILALVSFHRDSRNEVLLSCENCTISMFYISLMRCWNM